MKNIVLIFCVTITTFISLSAQCSLTNFSVTFNEDLCIGETGGVDFEFEGTNFGLNGFTVSSGPISQGYELGDDYILYLFSDCVDSYTVTITDNDDPDCTLSVEVDPICCPCELSYDLIVETSDCIDGEFFNATLDFSPVVGSCLWYDWDLNMNDNPITYEYSETDDIYSADDLYSEDSLLIFSFCNQGSGGECFSDTVVNPCYNLCTISNVSATLETCIDGLFDIIIDFEYNSGVSDDFEIVGNGDNYGTYSYDDLPITLTGISADCTTDYEFVVNDNEEDGCGAYTEIGEVCCESEECALDDLSISVGTCNEGIFEIEINFNYTGTTNPSFDYEIPGVISGFSSFADLPLILTIENTTTSELELYINENDNPNCAISGDFENPCFEETPDCVIDDVTAEVINCAEGIFDVIIDFEYNDGVSDNFEIVGNGDNYGTYSYDDLPITLTGISADCTTDYEFVVNDNEEDGCSAYTEIGEVCCESDNLISTINIEPVTLNNLLFFSFIVDHNATEGCDIDVFIDDLYDGTLSWDKFNYQLGGYDCDDNSILNIKLINNCTAVKFEFDLDLSLYMCSITSIEEDIKSKYRIDISNNMLTISNNNNYDVTLNIVDINGRVITSRSTFNNSNRVDVSSYINGVYVVVVQDKHSNLYYTQKIVIVK